MNAPKHEPLDQCINLTGTICRSQRSSTMAAATAINCRQLSSPNGLNWLKNKLTPGFGSDLTHTDRQCAKNSTCNMQSRKRMCELVIGLSTGPNAAWTVCDLHCRIRSGVTLAKAIEQTSRRSCPQSVFFHYVLSRRQDRARIRF